MASDLDRIADELYGLLPGDFTGARDARAAEARKAGDRPLATAIKALRRPTVAAWLANWLARQEAEQLGRLLDLGAAMRRAQDHLDGDQLRQLSRQRHQVVAALGAQARRAAFDAGLTVGEGAVRELEDALNAALADDEAADALRTGRLATMTMRPAGFGAAAALKAPAPTTGPALAKGNDKDKDAADAADEQRQEAAAEHRRQIEEAEQAVAGAEAVVAGRRQEAEDGLRVVVEARSRRDHVRQSIRDLEAQLDALRDEESDAAATLQDAEQSTEEAERAAEAAEARRDDLGERLAQLRAGAR